MNIIFLDFDGVVSSKKCGSYIFNPPEKYGYDPEIIARLKKFCNDTDTKIIISSNWRKFPKDGWYSFPEGRVQNPLPKLRETLKDYIIGELPPERHCSKSECLILWFEETGIKFDGYVILDDDPREGFQSTYDHGIRDHFILTNKELGFTDSDAEKAKKIFALNH